MSELINNSARRKELLKHMILQLHEGVAPEEANERLLALLKKIPYGEVVEVEQELINEGLPETEVLKLCDVHTKALEGIIDLDGAQAIPAGHPVDTFRKENDELMAVVENLELLYLKAKSLTDQEIPSYINQLKAYFNSLSDVEKHYQRKENLLFPFLEKYGITGPPKVMWGKHDQTREMLKTAHEALNSPGKLTAEEIQIMIDLILKPASTAIIDMTMKENEILSPMSMDKLTDLDWYEIYRQTPEIGFCLYDPQIEWKPEGIADVIENRKDGDKIHLPSGSFSVDELTAIMNTMPYDLTFVDRNDRVKYFSQGAERIFNRNRAILGRDVRLCHPPSSVNVVEQIISDFKSGRQASAPFWINMQGKFIHIEYFALRNPQGEYLGTLEVSQDLTAKRALDGEQRLLSYSQKEN